MIFIHRNTAIAFLLLCAPIFQSCSGGSSSPDNTILDSAETEDVNNSPESSENEGIDAEETQNEPTVGETETTDTEALVEAPDLPDTEQEISDSQTGSSTENELDTEQADTQVPPRVVAYRPRDTTPNLAGSYVIDPSAQVAAFGSELGSDTFMFGTGTLEDGITNWLSLGTSLPGMPPSTTISSLNALTRAPDSSVAFIARLVGSQPGSAIASIESGVVTTVVRDGQALDLANADSGVVQFFGQPQKMAGSTVFTVTFEDGRFILVSFDGEVYNSIPGVEITYTSGQTICNFTNVQSGQFQFFVTEQQEVIFTVEFSDVCPVGSGVMKYTATGDYELLIADDQPIAGMQNTFFGPSQIIESSADGVVGITNNVSIDFNNEPSNSTRIFARSWWQIDNSLPPKLLLAERETVETLDRSYAIESTDIEQLDWHSSGNFSAHIEFPNESALFVGEVNDSIPYLNFSDVGESVLTFVIGTTSVVPEPFTNRTFFSEFNAIHMLGDGRLLFFATVDSTDGSIGRTTTLWVTDGTDTPELVLSSGDQIPLTSGGEVTYNGQVLRTFFELADGSVLIGSGTTFYRLYLD